MTEQQQKLYDKLLKKVNEYCLGAAAEDVIAAIDALVENYESRTTEADGYATQYAEALRFYRKRMEEWESGHSVDFSKVRFEVQNLLPDPGDIGKKLKAFEIIKKKKVDIALLFYVNNADMYNRAKQFYNHNKITQEEYEILKEALK